jgi:hypothetical protein
VALLHIERGDLPTAGRLLAESVGGGVSTGANACLFHGAPALEFVLSRAGRIRRDVRAAVDGIVTARLAAAARRRAANALPRLAEFDLIQGLTGLGVVLLDRSPAPSPLLTGVLTYLVSLADPADADPMLPGWWTPDAPGHGECTGGHGNNGIAHGIAGPLALLSHAARRGIRVDGQQEAIEVFARWLERFFGRYWVTRDDLTLLEPPPPGIGRPSWCYGTLGVARALQLAALATGDPARRQAAEQTAVTAVTDPQSHGLVTDASLCHGWAGLLTLTRAIAADSPDPGRFTDPIDHLAGRLAAAIDTLGKPGFLEGRAGARLALERTDRTGWTRALLIT